MDQILTVMLHCLKLMKSKCAPFWISQTLLLNQKLGTDSNLWKCEFLSTSTKFSLLSPAECSALKLGVHKDCSQPGALPQL